MDFQTKYFANSMENTASRDTVQIDPEQNRFSRLSTADQLDEIWVLVAKLGPLATQVLHLEEVLGNSLKETVP